MRPINLFLDFAEFLADLSMDVLNNDPEAADMMQNYEIMYQNEGELEALEYLTSEFLAQKGILKKVFVYENKPNER